VMGLTWTSSNPAVVSLSTDDPPVLTAVAAGHVTITAGTGSADVTVWAGALPVGTTIWSNPGNGSGVSWIVPAVPSASGVADVFAIQNDGTVQAIASDGTVAWTADVSQAYLGSWYKNYIPDFQGGLVIQGNGGNRNPWIEKLDGVTGAPYPKCYLGPSAAILQTEGGTSPYVAAHPDGTVFAVVESTVWPGPVSVVGIDPTTGTQKFSVPLPQDACAAHYFCGLIIAGDGYAYVVYEAIAADPGAYYIDASVMLLRIGTDGSYDRIHVYDWVYAGDDYAWNTPYDAGMITNADTGILLTWMMSDGSVWMAVTAGTSASLVGAPGGMQVTPVLQAQDGSFFGTAYADIMAFDASGNVRWLVPNDSPAIATADGGVIGTSGITYDANGNATGTVGSLPTLSWTGNWYQDGDVGQVSLAPAQFAFSYAAIRGANPSGSGAHVRPLSAPQLALYALATANLAAAPQCSALLTQFAKIARIPEATLIAQLQATARGARDFVYDGPSSNTLLDPAKFPGAASPGVTTVGEWFGLYDVSPYYAEGFSQFNGYAVWFRLRRCK